MSTCPPSHRHGATQTCYRRHACRCDECRTAAAAYEANRRQRIGHSGIERLPADQLEQTPETVAVRQLILRRVPDFDEGREIARMLGVWAA